MTTTFDRYLLSRFFSVFCILFVSTYGLFVVIDGFTNVDGFQEGRQGVLEVLLKMLGYYAFHSTLFFNMVGSILSVISVMVVFALLYRHSEIHPILAAGIPIYRLLLPVIVGTLSVSVALLVNQELILPRISHRLQASRSGIRGDSQKVEAVYDHASRIRIGGEKLHLRSKQMEGVKFVLPATDIARDLTVLKAQEAIFHEKTKDHSAGWLLGGVSPPFDEDLLTSEGRRWVKTFDSSNKVFVVTDISFDQLYNRSRSYKYVSTPELIRRIKNPAFGIISVRGQTLHLHTRFMRPLLDLFIVPVAVALIIRRESRGLVGNMAICAGVVGSVFGLAQLFGYLGSVNLLSAALAAWSPVILAGSLGTWLTGVVQT